MTLYLISLGLAELDDMSLKAYNTAKKCKHLFVEVYTSKGATPKELTKTFGQEVTPLTREGMENDSKKLVELAKKSSVGIFIYGHALGATTHLAILEECNEHGVSYEVIHGSSILTAVAVTGLSLYNFGKTTSIPFLNTDVEVPYNVIKNNQKIGLHTLCLLDLKDGDYMNYQDALNYLLRMEKKKEAGVMSKDQLLVVCGQLGTKKEQLLVGTASQLKKKTLDVYPQVLIIPGKMQFFEEEFLEFLT